MNVLMSRKEQEILRTLIPWNSLPMTRFKELCTDVSIEEHPKGAILFEQGDTEKEFVYLISGMISLFAGEMEMESVVTGSEAARFAIAHHLPRKVKAIAKSKVRIVRLATYKLDMDRPKESTPMSTVSDETEGGDWMMTMLQSPVFQRLPAANLQKIMMQMEEISFEAGDVVVNQGDAADYYYIIKSGDCELIRQASAGARPIKLAELHSCEAFGEDALLSGNPRNVTVKMKGKGRMLRLSKESFISLVKEPVLQYVSFDEGLGKVNEGAGWLDVRSPDIYDNDHIDNSINIPFFSLRMKVAELRHDQLQVLVCDNGRTSEAAAFLLLKFGFNALILKDGMQGLKEKISVSVPKVAAEAVKKVIAEERSEKSVMHDASALIAKAANETELEQLASSKQEREVLKEKLAQQNLVMSDLKLNVTSLSEKLQASRGQFDEHLKAEKNQSALLLEELELQKAKLSEVRQIASDDAQRVTQLKLEQEEIAVNRDEQVKVLNEELAKQVFNLAVSEEAKVAAESTLKTKLDEFESVNEGVAQQHLLELELKKAECGEKSEHVAKLEAELKGLVGSGEKQGQAILDKQSELTDIIGKLSDASAQLVALKETQASLELALVAAEQVSTDTAKQLVGVVEERDALHQHLTQAESDACIASDGRASLKAQLLDADKLQVGLREELGAVNASAEDLRVLNAQLEGRLVASEVGSKELRQDSESIQHELNRADISLSELVASKDDLEKELTEQLVSIKLEFEQQLSDAASERAALESTLSKVETDKQRVDQQLVDEVQAKSSAHEQLLALQDQLASGLNGQEQLTEQLGALRAELEQVSQAGESERVDLNASLEQAALAYQELEQSLGEQKQQFSDIASEQAAERVGLESTLSTMEADKQRIDRELVEAVQAKDSTHEQLLALQDQLASGLNGQDQLTEQLGVLRAELEQVAQAGESERVELKTSLEQAELAYQALEGSLSEQKQLFSDTASEQAAERAALESTLSTMDADKQRLDQQLVDEVQAKDGAHEQLLALQDQLASGLNGQDQLTEQLGVLRAELEQVSRTGESERVELKTSLEQAELAYQELERSLSEQQQRSSVVESEQIEQSEALEKALCQLKVDHQDIEMQLVDVSNAKNSVDAKLLEMEAQLTSGGDSYDQLLMQLKQAEARYVDVEAIVTNKVSQSERDTQRASSLELELVDMQKSQLQLDEQLALLQSDKEGLQLKVSDVQSELLSVNATQEQQQEELKQAKKELLVNAAAGPVGGDLVELEAAKERCKELSESVDKLSAERLSDDRLFKRQLIDWDAKLQKAEEDKLALEGVIEEHKVRELLALDNEGKADEDLRCEIVELELTIERVQQQSEQGSLAVATALKDQALLEEQLRKVSAEAVVLKKERDAVAAVASEGGAARVSELESQLEEVTTQLLDLEIKQKLSVVEKVDEPRVESVSELKALQSELSLVREQTEKDVLVMQEKLGHSEKVNMALKKKILSMQGTSKIEEPASGEPKEKAKSWWQT